MEGGYNQSTAYTNTHTQIQKYQEKREFKSVQNFKEMQIVLSSKKQGGNTFWFLAVILGRK